MARIRRSNITFPTVDFEDVLPLATVKAHLRVEHDEDDDLIEIYRDTAMLHAMNETQQMIGNGTYIYKVSMFPGSCDPENSILNHLVYPSSAIAIEYHDGSAWQTFGTSNYDFASEAKPNTILFLDTVDVNEDMQFPIKITATGGHTDETLPKRILQGILLYIGHLYEHRQDYVAGTIVTAVPKTSEFLFQSERIFIP